MSDIDNFLKKIAQVESSGGENFQHAKMTSGIHKGSSAIGAFGLMPNTVDEVIGRMGDDDLQDIKSMNPKEKKAYLEKNPDVEYRIAKELASQVLEKQGGDEQKAAYAWNHGHNMSPKNIEANDYQDSDYVQKFNKAKTDSDIYKERYPLSIEGKPEAEKVKQYLSGDSRYKDLIDTLQSNDKRINMLKALQNSVMINPEEKTELQLQPDKMVMGMGMGSIGKAVPTQSVFDKIRGLFKKQYPFSETGATMTPAEQQATFKAIGLPETLPTELQGQPFYGPQPRGAEGSAAVSAHLQDTAQNIGKDTLPPTDINQLNELLKLGKKR